MQPVIGLNCDVVVREGRRSDPLKIELWRHYVTAVEKAGGVPLLLPPVEDAALIPAQLAAVQGVVLVGGRDYDPALYGAAVHSATDLHNPVRSAYDVRLASAVLERRLPVLAICGGLQLVNIVRGGSLEQHVPDLPGVTCRHNDGSEPYAHDVAVQPKSRLAAIVGGLTLPVNSSHHQAVGRTGRGLRVTARSTDGLIEAVEGEPADGFLLGVQWHPERLTADPRHLALFTALVSAAVAWAPGHRTVA